jgi:uncharacterized membrane protein YjjP (DUF1212 family)
MTEKPRASFLTAANLYLFAGVAFLASGVSFLLTSQNGLWVVFFALGIVFIVLSTIERAKTAKTPPTSSAPDDAPPT